MTACPVCRASFRGSAVCPRCGADLAPLMKLVVRGWRLRQAAREALAADDFDQAHQLSAEAQQLHATPSGAGLLAVAAWKVADSACR